MTTFPTTSAQREPLLAHRTITALATQQFSRLLRYDVTLGEPYVSIEATTRAL